MRITGVYIDGFGIFHNQSISGLDKNLVIFYGNNEAGKSTLLGFIRSVLFGFPRANSRDPSYLPIAGGVRGGRVDFITASGDAWSVSRKPGVSGGAVTITGSDGRVHDKAALDQLLGGVSYEAFRNVMAFGLTELQSMETLSGQHITSAIYGAGLGTSMMAMPRARKKIRDQMAQLFLKGGRKQIINQLTGNLEQIRKALHDASLQVGHYDTTCDALAQVEKEVQNCRDKLTLNRQKQQRYDSLARLWIDWITFKESQQELATLGPPPGKFPEDGLSMIDRLTETRDRNRAAVTELTVRRTRISDQVAALPVDEKMLIQTAAISSLVENRNTYLENTRALPLLLQEKQNHTDTVNRLLQRLGSRWNEATALNFDRSLFTRETIRKHQTALDSLEGNLAATEILLTDKKSAAHQAAGTRRSAEKEVAEKGSSSTKWPVVVVGAAGAAITGIAVYFGSYRDAALLMGGALAATWATWLYCKQQREAILRTRNQLLEKEAAEETAHQALEKILAARHTLTQGLSEEKTTWANRCRELGLSDSLSPATALEALDSIEQTVEAIQARDRCITELFRIEKEIDTYQQLAQQTLTAVGWHAAVGDILPQTVNDLVSNLEESKGNKRGKETLEPQMARLEKERISAEETLRETEATVRDLFKAAGTPDEEAFRKIGRAEQKRLQFLSAAETAEGNMRRISGEIDISPLKKTLESLSLAEIKAAEAAAARTAQALDPELSALYARRAELKQALETLSNSNDISQFRAEEAEILADLEARALEWSRYALADHLINQAREVFEKKHQPRIIQDAGNIFSQMTGGRYQGVVSPLGENTLSAVTQNGERISPDRLSRGTAEQLYLAVRFSYIHHQARSNDPLPVIMDDILVNFDPTRAQKAAEAIMTLSASHQVLLFTCHPETVNIFKDIDPDLPVCKLDGGRIFEPVKHLGPKKVN